MRRIVDFHIHSKYSRATSKHLDLAEIAKWSERKGLDIVSSGDFTHPRWLSEIKSQLTEDGSGLLSHQAYPKMKFMLGSEVACIYRHKDQTRRLHHVLLSPSIASVEKLNEALTKRGCKLASDGRPILGMSSKELLHTLLEVDDRMVMIPAHIWTPWFALFGSKSGYDALEDCFEDLSDHIFALETGLSSDPLMNRALSKLDRYALVSNSDAHSGPKLGREANVFDLADQSYDAIMDALKKRDTKKFLYTIEFFPEEGMYHFDGHRACKVSFAPDQTKKHKGICPVCRKPLTIGVMNRVDNLRNREFGAEPAGLVPYKHIVPLPDILADYFQMSDTSQRVMKMYFDIIARGANEFHVLLDAAIDDLKSWMPHDLAEGIIRVREGRLSVTPGYDGNYGSVSIFSAENRSSSMQKRLL